jgi:hypothetical protein
MHFLFVSFDISMFLTGTEPSSESNGMCGCGSRSWPGILLVGDGVDQTIPVKDFPALISGNFCELVASAAGAI